jgi:hypothetical protein
LELLEDRLAPATFNVTTLADSVAVNLTTGQDASGQVSLRSAIQAADATSGANAINVPAGTYTLSIPGPLDITNDLTISGAGANSTIIDGNFFDQVFRVDSGNVTISGVTVRRGISQEGGGLYSDTSGRVTLLNDIFTNNVAVGATGAAGTPGAPGQAGGAGGVGLNGLGGGIFNGAGLLAMVNCAVLANVALGGYGGNGGAGGRLTGANGSAEHAGSPATGGAGGAGGNAGFAEGGGLYNQQGAAFGVANSVFAFNRAVGGKGGEGGTGGNGTGGAGGEGPDNGGAGTGGAGGVGGEAAFAEGGGLYNNGVVGIVGTTVSVASNDAIGGYGGDGGFGGAGTGGHGGNSFPFGSAGGGGIGTGGNGAVGGVSAGAKGGGISNGAHAILFGTALSLTNNRAYGGDGGGGGFGGNGTGGNGGMVDAGGGAGGAGIGGTGGDGGDGTLSLATGGGLFNHAQGTVSFTANLQGSATAVVAISSNLVEGGFSGGGGTGGDAFGANGGNSPGRNTLIGANGRSGPGGFAQGGNGGGGGASGDVQGGGISNFGSATFTGVTLNLTGNDGYSGFGSNAGTGGTATGGNGGAGPVGAAGGNAIGGNGGSGAQRARGNSFGGGLFNGPGATLVISPRRGAAAGSAQSGATDSVNNNRADLGFDGVQAVGGTATGGAPSAPNTTTGTATPGQNGTGSAVATIGVGGGLYLASSGAAFISNAIIQGNQADTSDNDVFGTYMPAP